ncbi:DNA pilot protein [Microviridae sp.]|nr:DNA pilot protein [Microviridae sp.]
MCKTNADIWRSWSDRSFLMIEAFLGAGASLLGTHMRNKAAKSASARQMAFQKDMSNTSYQRGMSDMKKAGLNPILAGKFGGASTPTGSTYNPENVTTNAVQQFNQTKLIAQQARNQQLDADLKALDYNALKKAGLSPMMMKHTVLNQAGSEMYSNAKDIYGSVKKELLPKILQDDFVKDFVTGKALTKGMQGNSFDIKVRKFINDIKNYYKSRTGGKRTRYVK